MRWLLRKCPQCSSYTLREICPYCGVRTVTPHPPRFSPKDKYVRERFLIRLEDQVK